MCEWLICGRKVYCTFHTVKRTKQEPLQCGFKECFCAFLSSGGELPAIAPLLEQVKAGRVASFSLLTRSLCLKYIYFVEVQGVFQYQVPPLVCTQQQGFSLKFQHQLGFFSGERERKTYSNWHDHYLKDYFLWRLLNTWVFTCLFSDLLELKVDIQKSHLIPSSSLDFKGLQVIYSGDPWSAFYIS